MRKQHTAEGRKGEGGVGVKLVSKVCEEDHMRAQSAARDKGVCGQNDTDAGSTYGKLRLARQIIHAVHSGPRGVWRA
jgi:hypothetical protein